MSICIMPAVKVHNQATHIPPLNVTHTKYLQCKELLSLLDLFLAKITGISNFCHGEQKCKCVDNYKDDISFTIVNQHYPAIRRRHKQ